jgi:hypothetical protein
MVKKARKKAKPTEEVEDFTPGIFDQVIVNWDQLEEFSKDPLNWKDHPIRQKQALASTIKANGYAKPLIYNVHLRKFLDGHGRYDVAIKEQHVNIPIALGRWTEEQHRHVLQTLDPIGAMYEVNQAALHSLNEARKRDNEKAVGDEDEFGTSSSGKRYSSSSTTWRRSLRRLNRARHQRHFSLRVNEHRLKRGKLIESRKTTKTRTPISMKMYLFQRVRWCRKLSMMIVTSLPPISTVSRT